MEQPGWVVGAWYVHEHDDGTSSEPFVAYEGADKELRWRFAHARFSMKLILPKPDPTVHRRMTEAQIADYFLDGGKDAKAS